MTTPRSRSLVSLAAALTVALTLGACAGVPSRLEPDAPAPADAPQLTLRFDNDARDYVQVYLVGAQREWALGRVEPGAHAMLRIPGAALAEDAGPVWLAVLTGERATLRVAGDARAVTTLAQPAAAILSQRWTFSHSLANGQLTPLPLGRGQAGTGRR